MDHHHSGGRQHGSPETKSKIADRILAVMNLSGSDFLAALMLATTLGVEFDPNTDWNEGEQVFKMSEKIVRTFNITQTAEGDKTGLWTTVIAAAILLP